MVIFLVEDNLVESVISAIKGDGSSGLVAQLDQQLRDKLGRGAEITRFKGLGEISPSEFKDFISDDGMRAVALIRGLRASTDRQRARPAPVRSIVTHGLSVTRPIWSPVSGSGMTMARLCHLRAISGP